MNKSKEPQQIGTSQISNHKMVEYIELPRNELIWIRWYTDNILFSSLLLMILISFRTSSYELIFALLLTMSPQINAYFVGPLGVNTIYIAQHYCQSQGTSVASIHSESEHANEMLVEFNKMQQQINTLVELQSDRIRNNDKSESEMDKVRIWMNDIVKLPQYSEIIIQNGYDDMESVADIILEDLCSMGVEKIGHRRKIIKNAKKLKEKKNMQQINRSMNNNDNDDNVHNMNQMYYQQPSY